MAGDKEETTVTFAKKTFVNVSIFVPRVRHEGKEKSS
jgi:hypothetical protein